MTWHEKHNIHILFLPLLVEVPHYFNGASLMDETEVQCHWYIRDGQKYCQ